VGHIAKLLDEHGENVLDAKLSMKSSLSQLGDVGTVFFHQPFSHLCCLLYAVAVPNHRARLCCVLHEASNYNLGVAPIGRAIVGSLIRFLVIWCCFMLGIQIKGVSNYVCSTYLMRPKTISFLHLFRESLENATSDISSAPRDNLAVVWLRRGDGKRSYALLCSLYEKAGLSTVVVLGDALERESLMNMLELGELVPKKIEALDVGCKTSETEFFSMLRRSKWFVSTYPREGFGLSAFQAAYFGSVVLAAKTGAVVEWLPELNYAIAEKILNSAVEIKPEEIQQGSSINIKFARTYLRNED
jgi:glycosyltransferase involved in cell wall biosynthesis